MDGAIEKWGGLGIVNKGMYSSIATDWETPWQLVRSLERRYGCFDLDPCASQTTAKAPAFFSAYEDGLRQDWHGDVFMNPPYGRVIGQWVEKAFSEARIEQRARVCCLLPAQTNTKWWHTYCQHADEILFLKGRLHFSQSGPAPFPSAIVIFRPPLADLDEGSLATVTEQPRLAG